MVISVSIYGHKITGKVCCAEPVYDVHPSMGRKSVAVIERWLLQRVVYVRSFVTWSCILYSWKLSREKHVCGSVGSEGKLSWNAKPTV